jgi:hypothetical protein
MTGDILGYRKEGLKQLTIIRMVLLVRLGCAGQRKTPLTGNRISWRIKLCARFARIANASPSSQHPAA